MSPALSVLIPTDTASRAELQGALLGLRSQSCPDWEAVLVGPDEVSGTLARDDRRARILPARAGRTELLNLAIDAARGGFVLILEPRDTLAPHALAALLAAQSESDAPGVVGGYRFESRIGPLPQDPLADLPDVLGYEQLIRAELFPTSTLLISRNALGFFRTEPEDAWAYDHWLHLTEAGLTFARCKRTIASVPMGELSTPYATLDALIARLRTVRASLERMGRAELMSEVASDLCDAFITLRSHQKTLDRDGDQHLTQAVRFPHLFAQWWQRLWFLGQPPRHVLEANGNVEEGIASSPELIATRLIDLCSAAPHEEPPILLGLGRNARHIAKRLHARGIRVRGRDDSLTGPPAWSVEDGVPVELIGRDRPYDPRAAYVMTLLSDAGYLARLPKGLTIHRWSAMPKLILTELRGRILDARAATPLEATPA